MRLPAETKTMAYQKLALKRDPDAPAGQPAEMHVDCPCGQEVIIISNDNACDCGAVYDGAGWVKRSSVASHTETAPRYLRPISNPF
jgi:hypothetical protein